MTVNVTKPQINVREKLSELDKPSGIAGEAILRSETPQEVFNYINAGRRNLIINGDMQVAQRAASATFSASAYDALDRWKSTKNHSDHVGTIAQVADGPDGFANSLKITTTTAETSISSAEYMTIRHRIEATGLQQLAYGTSNAKSVAVSFYVKSSEPGQYAFNLYSNDGNRIITSTYVINSADTWEYKSVVIPGDQSGTIVNNITVGLELAFIIAAGTDYTSSDSTSWGTYTNAKFAYGHEQNAVFTTVNATWQITGVQLEVGKVATPFEHRSYGEELALCQRYYQVIGSSAFPHIWTGDVTNGNSYYNPLPYKNDLRATPTVTFTNSSNSNFGTVNAQVRSGSGRLYAAATATAARAYYEQIVRLDAEL